MWLEHCRASWEFCFEGSIRSAEFLSKGSEPEMQIDAYKVSKEFIRHTFHPTSFLRTGRELHSLIIWPSAIPQNRKETHGIEMQMKVKHVI